jgi:hypothetical protein
MGYYQKSFDDVIKHGWKSAVERREGLFYSYEGLEAPLFYVKHYQYYKVPILKTYPLYGVSPKKLWEKWAGLSLNYKDIFEPGVGYAGYPKSSKYSAQIVDAMQWFERRVMKETIHLALVEKNEVFAKLPTDYLKFTDFNTRTSKKYYSDNLAPTGKLGVRQLRIYPFSYLFWGGSKNISKHRHTTGYYYIQPRDLGKGSAWPSSNARKSAYYKIAYGSSISKQLSPPHNLNTFYRAIPYFPKGITTQLDDASIKNLIRDIPLVGKSAIGALAFESALYLYIFGLISTSRGWSASEVAQTVATLKKLVGKGWADIEKAKREHAKALKQFNYVFTEKYNRDRSGIVDFDWDRFWKALIVVAAIVAVAFIAAALSTAAPAVSEALEGGVKDLASGEDPLEALEKKAKDKLASYVPEIPVPQAIKDIASEIKVPFEMTADEYKDLLLDKLAGKEGQTVKDKTIEEAVAAKDKAVDQQIKDEGAMG